MPTPPKPPVVVCTRTSNILPCDAAAHNGIKTVAENPLLMAHLAKTARNVLGMA